MSFISHGMKSQLAHSFNSDFKYADYTNERMKKNNNSLLLCFAAAGGGGGAAAASDAACFIETESMEWLLLLSHSDCIH